jgi:FKBP-type peptidyl-prolyl cis-trans isomerases 1
MRKFSVIICGLAILLSTGCSDVGYKKTKSGLRYKIVSTGNPPATKQGQWLKFHVKQSVNDSLMGETYGQMPMYMPVDSVPATYDPREVIPLLRKGDSAVVVMFGDSIIKRQGGLPPFMGSPKDKLIITFKVLDVLESDSAKLVDERAVSKQVQAEQMAAAETKREEVTKDIEAYLAENNIKYEKAPGGTYVVIHDPGTDPKADSGTTARVRYRGTLYKTDKVFDENKNEGYIVRVGTGSVVRGWEEGLPYFGKGGKGVLYVPFWQGYGPRGIMNTPYATMVFEIEVADVTLPATSPQPSQPNK